MRDRTRHRTVGGTRRRSSALPNEDAFAGSTLASTGLLLRGVVVATYVQLDGTSPFTNDEFSKVVGVYCDVFVYSSHEGLRECMLRRCLVSQPYGGGMHEGHIWKPRAAKVDVANGEINEETVEPRDLDGDHVLVGFMDDLITQPVILRAVPHPRWGDGNNTNDAGNPARLGHRTRLKLADGEPDLWKHHGVFHGVDGQGNYVIDATRGHDGNYRSNGLEDPGLGGDNGNVTVRVNHNSKFNVAGTDSELENSLFDLVIEDNTLTLLLQAGESLKVVGKGAGTTMQVGDGDKHVPIVETLESFYGTTKADYDLHTHPEAPLRAALGAAGAALTVAGLDPTLVGLASTAATALVTAGTALATAASSVPTAPATPAPVWNAAINSSKVSIPDG